MKIAITGHTKGLGHAFFQHYQEQGHTVVGYSRRNGNDLRDWKNLQRLIDQTQDYDLLVSCAKPDFVQCFLLYEIARRSQHVKCVMSIGSMIAKTVLDPKADIGIHLYRTQKLALCDAHRQLIGKLPVFNSILIHPGHLYDAHIDMERLKSWIHRMESAVQDHKRIEIDVD